MTPVAEARIRQAVAELADALVAALAAEAVPPGPPRTFSVEQAAELANLGRTFMFREIAAGRLRVIRRGRRVLVTESALREYLDGPPA